MRIAVVAIYTDPTRLPRKEPSPMQSAVPEMIAGLCPPSAEIELFHEKEVDVPLDREWELRSIVGVDAPPRCRQA